MYGEYASYLESKNEVIESANKYLFANGNIKSIRFFPIEDNEAINKSNTYCAETIHKAIGDINAYIIGRTGNKKATLAKFSYEPETREIIFSSDELDKEDKVLVYYYVQAKISEKVLCTETLEPKKIEPKSLEKETTLSDIESQLDEELESLAIVESQYIEFLMIDTKNSIITDYLEKVKSDIEKYSNMILRIQKVCDFADCGIVDIRSLSQTINDIESLVFEKELFSNNNYRKYESYYFPLLEKLINKYAEIVSTGAEGENIDGIKAQIKKAVKNLEVMFKELLNRLKQNEINFLDIESDIDVLG